jgi:hypothetical protein
MDVDKLQKVQRLAQELIDHKIVESMDDAVAQAENIINKKQEVQEVRKEVEKDTQKLEPEMDVTLEVKKLQTKISEQAKLMGELRSQLDVMVSDIKSLREEQTNLKETQQTQKPFLEKSPEKPQTTLVKEEAKEVKEEKSEEGHPKVGEFKSQDVSVEKMFYCGPKDEKPE